MVKKALKGPISLKIGTKKKSLKVDKFINKKRFQRYQTVTFNALLLLNYFQNTTT